MWTKQQDDASRRVDSHVGLDDQNFENITRRLPEYYILEDYENITIFKNTRTLPYKILLENYGILWE